MEEVKKFEDAWEGDLVEYKGRTYRVVSAAIVEAGHFKRLKVVNPYPLFPLARIKTIYQ